MADDFHLCPGLEQRADNLIEPPQDLLADPGHGHVHNEVVDALDRLCDAPEDAALGRHLMPRPSPGGSGARGALPTLGFGLISAVAKDGAEGLGQSALLLG